MTDKELDDLFQQKLSGHRMPVSPGMWDRVNPQEDNRRRGAFLWWSVLGIAAFFIIIGTAVWLYQAPSQSERTAQAAQAKTQEPQSSPEQKTTLSQQPADTINGAAAPGASNGFSSSQTTSANNNNTHRTKDFYTSQNHQPTEMAVSSKQQNTSPAHADNFITGNQNGTQPNSNYNHQDNTTADNSSSNQSNTSLVPAALGKATDSSANQPVASMQKTGSNHTAPVNNSTAQAASTSAIKVKKIHGEKTPSLEFMVAGYGDSRTVYDVISQLRTSGVVAFGPINTKEEVLMHSISLNARIDKPLTKNISVKTGLQYSQIRQNTSYSFQSVDQSMVINSLTDTTVFARLQTKQSEVKGTYNSLGIPVLISYHTSAKKVNLGATAGVVVNVLSWYDGKVTSTGNSQAILAKNAFRAHTGTSLYAGLTASKQVGSFQLFAEPHIQYTLSSITKNSASFRQKITGYGFGIGIRKTIGK